jgi:uncharacterized membrane protein YkoI
MAAMRRTTKWIAGATLGGAAIAAAAALGAATAFAGGGADANRVVEDNAPITGDALAKASAAALAAVGGGTVTQTEVGDEESYYEVEVTFADGHQVDVQLDENYNLVLTMPDGDSGR